MSEFTNVGNGSALCYTISIIVIKIHVKCNILWYLQILRNYYRANFMIFPSYRFWPNSADNAGERNGTMPNKLMQNIVTVFLQG